MIKVGTYFPNVLPVQVTPTPQLPSVEIAGSETGATHIA